MSDLVSAKLSHWYGAYAPALVLYARQFAPDAAEDLVHEAFVHLLALPAEPRNVRAWLYTAVRNAAVSLSRSRTRRDAREHRLPATAWFTPDPAELLDAAAAQQALAQLPPEQREIVVLRIWSQMSFAEIADLCQSPLSSIYDLYRRALTGLRHHLEPSCPDPTKKTP